MIVIQRAQLQTFVIIKLVNVFVKMALEDQDVMNVHLGFSKINIFRSSNASHVGAPKKDQPQKFVIMKMGNVYAKKMFQEEHANIVKLITMDILIALVS